MSSFTFELHDDHLDEVVIREMENIIMYGTEYNPELINAAEIILEYYSIPGYRNRP